MTNKNIRYLINHILEIYGNRRTLLYSQGKPCMTYEVIETATGIILTIRLKVKNAKKV